MGDGVNNNGRGDQASVSVSARDLEKGKALMT